MWFNVRNGRLVFPYNFSYGGPTSVVGLRMGCMCFCFCWNSKGGHATASIMFSVDCRLVLS